MRLIDVDALMESIRKALGIKSMTKSLLLPAERTIIDQIVSAPTVGGWISVKDRLPEKCGRYLCWFGGNKCVVGAEIETYLPELHGFGSFERYEVYPNITHWMPLPEPPLQGNRSTLSS